MLCYHILFGNGDAVAAAVRGEGGLWARQEEELLVLERVSSISLAVPPQLYIRAESNLWRIWMSVFERLRKTSKLKTVRTSDGSDGKLTKVMHFDFRKGHRTQLFPQSNNTTTDSTSSQLPIPLHHSNSTTTDS